MTNETPENPQNTPTNVPESVNEAAGQHGFDGRISSDAVAPDAAPESAPAPDSAIEPEPVVAPIAEPVVAPVEAPAVVSPNDAPAYPQAAPGGHELPGAPYPGAAQTAPAQQPAPGYAPNTPIHDPNAPIYDPNAAVYPGTAPAYDPNAPQGYSAGGYPSGAYSAAPAAPKKPMSKGLLFGLIGGAAALVLLIAAAIIVPNLLRGAAPTASDAVEEYLTALSEGDAETALTFVETYADDSLLTDEVLAASLELAPITDIVVAESEDATEYEATVSASFAVGGETIEREFTAYSSSDDGWVISDGLVMATLSNFEGLGLTVNGAEPADSSTSLFPGAYRLALGYEEFALDSETDTFTLTTDDDSELFWDIYPVLTDDGAATFRSLVRTAIEECVAMKTLATPCGMDITDIDLSGYTPVDGSVTRTITSDGQATLDSMVADVDYSTPTLVSTYDTPDVDMTLQGTKDGTTSEFEVWFGGYMDTPSVDFAQETPTVTWD
ncbi:hypothetical protein [Microbacterium sp. AK031]|uniref:hypothetical protein n=1 Tax=Microbacterium sp. AK031 TaxID=2723076 RepID=UPI00216A96EE|nr:hypothetical protein [Microbacterium sp. AK031]MCS3843088.1 hypothetical protein [Microbacterium sp. AK031]